MKRWDSSEIVLVATRNEVHAYRPDQGDEALKRSLAFENAGLPTKQHRMPAVLWRAAAGKAAGLGLRVFDHSSGIACAQVSA